MLTKNEIRVLNKKKRSEMSKSEAEVKSQAAEKMFLESEIYKIADAIMVYKPLGNETDTSNIIKQIFKDGKKACFPVTNPQSGEIIPYYADENTPFEKGSFSVYEPQTTCVADPKEIDVVIVPGIAFDRNGTRVGFGKGCYDRFLNKTNAVKVGFCYGFQISDGICADKHDVAMDYIVSESGIIKIEKEDVQSES